MVSWIVQFHRQQPNGGAAPANDFPGVDPVEQHSLLVSQLWDLGTTGVSGHLTGAGPGSAQLLAGFENRSLAERALALGHRHGLNAVISAAETEWPRWDASSVTVSTGTGTTTFSLVAGSSFGHGSHPTTALALGLMSRINRPLGRVLDLGTGSGVLAIAADLLGATAITAIDVDPDAIRIAEANFKANGVDAICSTASVDDLAQQGSTFDVVVANVLLPVHEQVAPAVRALVAPGGCVVVSGFLDTQWDRVADAYRHLQPARSEVVIVTTENIGEWWAAALQKGPSPR